MEWWLFFWFLLIVGFMVEFFKCLDLFVFFGDVLFGIFEFVFWLKWIKCFCVLLLRFLLGFIWIGNWFVVVW